MRLGQRDGVQWRRVAPIPKNVEIGVMLAIAGGAFTVVMSIGVFTDWVPGFDEFTAAPSILIPLAMALFGGRFALVGCYVSDVGVRCRWPYHTWTLRWEDISDLAIRKPGLLSAMRDETALQGICVVPKAGRARWTPLWSRAKPSRQHLRDAFVLSQYEFFLAFQELRETGLNRLPA
jgi:hypothetical protein